MREARQLTAIGLETGIVEAVAVDEPRALDGLDANEIRGRMSGPRLGGDALGRDRAEPETHGAPENGRVVVHRREDERIGEAHAAEGDGEARIGVAEHREKIEGEEPQSPLAEGHRDRLGEPRQHTAVEQSVDEIGGADHDWRPMVS